MTERGIEWTLMTIDQRVRKARGQTFYSFFLSSQIHFSLRECGSFS